MFKSVFGITVTMLVLCNDGTALELPANYFCQPLASGGIKFFEQRKVWDGVKFNLGTGFVIKLTSISDEGSGDSPPQQVSVELKNLGEDSSENCWPARKTGTYLTIQERQTGFSCVTFGGTLIFNYETLRYLETYTWGYTDGVDDVSDTPAITVGECTKIE